MKKASHFVLFVWLLFNLFLTFGISEAKNTEQLSIPGKQTTDAFRKTKQPVEISVESVLTKLRKKEDIVLVDVRNESDFDKVRIPGSLNIPLFALKTKAYLTARPVVLFNEGYCHARLEHACTEMKKAGFLYASIMTGGLNDWRQKGGPLEGDVYVIKELNRISAEEFYAERNVKDQIVIDISQAPDPKALKLIPLALSVPYNKDGTQFREELRKALKPKEKGLFRTVVVVNQDGRYPHDVEGLMTQAGEQNVYFLKHGLEGYRHFLEKQGNIRQGRTEKKIVQKCASCP